MQNKKRIAICYDFDKTLSPDDMQTWTLIPSFGMSKETFWAKTDAMAKENLMENNLAWMYQLIVQSKAAGKKISREYFNKIGAEVPLYNGVEEWFDNVNAYAKTKGIEVEHYVISSGLKEIIEGSKVGDKFNRIYASSYFYSPDGVAEWPAQAVNYTNKTQFIFRIAKGVFEEYDEGVNNPISESDLHIKYENIVYVGDSATDIPCMRLVKSKGGYSIGVYDPEKKAKEKVYTLFNDGRISFYAPADYSQNSEIFDVIKQIIDEVAAREKICDTKEKLGESASRYATYCKLKAALSNGDIPISQDEREAMEKIVIDSINEL